MDVTAFWKLIDETRKAAQGDPQTQSDLLTDELARLPADEIIVFDQIFQDLKDQAYIADLWHAAFIIMFYCSDDGFQEFREWLIGRGKDVYEKTLEDPETLVDVLDIGEQIFPTLLGPAMNAYERVTGYTMPPRIWKSPQLRGELMGEGREAEILARLPKLTAKFWKWWKTDKAYMEIRELLRQTLLPLGFRETELVDLGMAKYERAPLEVRFVLDYYVPDYTLFVFSGGRERSYPPAILFHFLRHKYNEETKIILHNALQQWLTMMEQ